MTEDFSKKMDSISIKGAIAVRGVLSMIKLKIYYVLLIILVSVNRKIDKGILDNFPQYETYCLSQPTQLSPLLFW